jgi:hypothetical protein
MNHNYSGASKLTTAVIICTYDDQQAVVGSEYERIEDGYGRDELV